MHAHSHARHDHAHADGHGDTHAHVSSAQVATAWREGNARRMTWALAVNVAMVAAAVVGALVTGSIALLADAGHVLSDVLAIALGIAAARVAMRPARGRGTFGLGRVEILAALVNGLALVAIAVWVAVEAVGRLGDPPHVDGIGVIAFGAAGLVGNAIATLVLAGGNRADVNLEGVLRHSLADALGSLGVVLAGAGILLTDWRLLDPLVGLAIAILILLSSWRLIREPVDVLLERAPAGLDVREVGETIASVDGVREVHDLHIWSITSGFPALAAHVTVRATHDPVAVRRTIESVLRERFALSHTTLQASCEELLQIDGPDVPARPF